MKRKRIMRFFLALVMFMGCLPLNSIPSYANDDINGSPLNPIPRYVNGDINGSPLNPIPRYANGDIANDNVNDGVKIDDAFPDENFSKYVRDKFDKDKNGYLSDTEVAAVTELSIGKQGISSLNGIGFFKNLTKLDCSGNRLTNLDVSHNTELTTLKCNKNNLASLDISNNTNLTKFFCSSNKLANLDISHNTELTELGCSSNKLSSLDVSHNTELTTLVCSHNKLTSLNLSHNTKLTTLNCDFNKLASLDISHNTDLTELNCTKNNLTSLAVSNNKNLTKLSCGSNNLKDLDVSHNTELSQLYCDVNELTSLDLSQNTKLTQLACDHNNLTSLDVSNNTNLTELNCANNNLENLNVNGNTELTYLECGGNNLKNLDISHNTNLTELWCRADNLTELNVDNNRNLTKLWCYDNKLTSLNLSNNTNLTNLQCYDNKLTSLDLSNNKRLTYLECYNNKLTSLDLSNNTNLTELSCGNQQYNILINKGAKKFEYSNFPGKFKKEKVISQRGAYFGDDALTVYSDTITYNYKVAEGKEMDVELNVTYFDPENVEKMEVKTPPKLVYKEGEKLDLTGLVVTLTDNQGVAKDVEFKDFEENKITVNPENNTELTVAGHNNKAVKLTRGKLTAETNKLTVAKKVEVPDPANPGTVTPDRVRVTFDAGEGNTIDGTNRYKVIDVLTGTTWDNTEVTKEIPKSAKYKDNTKEFKEWDSTVPDTGEVQEQEFTAVYKNKDLVKIGTDINATTPVGYTRVTFDAGEGNTIAGNRYKVIDVLTGTAWNDEKVKEQIPASATYKDNTKEFDKWDSTVPDTGEVQEKTFTAEYKDVVKTSTNPNAQAPDGYTRVTFDAGDGNTIAGTNDRYKVIDVLTGTAWNDEKVKEQIPASAKYKDTTKVFKEWSEAVPKAGTVDTAKTFTAEYKDVVKTGTDLSAQVPDGYTRVTFDAGDGNIEGNRYKVIDVLTGTAWDDEKVKDQIPASAKYKDTTKVFKEWSEAVPKAGTVDTAKTFTAEYKDVVKIGTDPNAQAPDGYTRVTFDAGEGNTIAGNRYKVIDVLNGTAWDNAEVTKEIPASAKYKDNTKVFDKWKETVPKAGNVEAKTFKAEYKAVGGTTPQDPKVVGPVDPTDPNGGKPADTSKYYTVTFVSEDETKGTVDAKNTVYVLKTENKTLADITAPKATAKEGYEFDKWEPALDANTSINGNLTVNAKFEKVTAEPPPTPQNPPVVDPTQPGGKPADTSKYYTITFKSEDETKGTVDAKNTVYVLKTENKTLADITAPKATAKAGYEFDKWEPALDKNTVINKDMTVKAYFKQKAKELDKKHGAENPSVTPNPSPTPDVTPNPDVTPTPDVTPSPDVTPTPETKAGWQKDEIGWWYLRENGTYPAGEWEPVNETWYHFDAQGYMQTGWLNLDGTWYYLNADGSMAKDTWIGTYYVDANGAWVVEGWQNSAYGWWYQRANGSYPHNEWEIINGIWYYFDSNGYMLADTNTPDGYYVDENGAWVK